MSIMKKTKEFFGLTPYEADREDAYYDDEPAYEGNLAYAPRYEEEPSYSHRYAATPATSATSAPSASRGVASGLSTAIVPVVINGYSDAALIGEPFRDGDAVVFNMGDIEHGDARRIVDFAAGLCFALRGTMQKLDSKVFAIVPERASVSTLELERAAGLR